MHRGSCHCGRVTFEVDGDFQEVIECNCSHCSRKGYLLWFVPKSAFRVTAGDGEYGTYLFNHHVIRHHFCRTCGCAPFAGGQGKDGAETAAINVRCLEDVDLATVRRVPFDGRSR